MSEGLGTPTDHYGLNDVGSLANVLGGKEGPRFESRSAHFNAGAGGGARNQQQGRGGQRQAPPVPPAGSATPGRLAAFAVGAAFRRGG